MAMKREYWIALALAGFLMMLPLGPLRLILLLFVPGFSVLVLLKERFDAVELVAYSFTLSILAFPIVVLLAYFGGVWHSGAFLLGLFAIAVAAYKYHRNSSIELAKARFSWPVLAAAVLVFAVVLFLILKTFIVTPSGFIVDTTQASDLNFYLSTAQHYITSPSIPPEDPYLPGYQILYNWFMQILMGELGVLTGVDLFAILHLLVPLVSALVFLDVYLLARLLFKSEQDALVASVVYVAASGLSWAYAVYQIYFQGISAPDIFRILVYDWQDPITKQTIMSLKYDPTSLYFFLPQTQTFGLLAMVFGFYMYIKTISTKSMAYALVSGIVLASLVMFHMITAFPVYVALGILFVYLILKKRYDTLLVAAVPLVPAVLASLYQLSIIQQGLQNQVVLGHNPDVPLTIICSIGLLIPFALYGMYLKWKDEDCTLLLIFAAINFVFLNVLELPATVNTYRFLVYMALPVSLFSGLVLSRWLSSWKVWMIAVAIAVILVMIPSTVILIGFYSDSPYTHATPVEYPALMWIKANTPANAIIYEEPGFFPRVPILTGRDVAYAGEIYTIQYHNVDLQADASSIMDITDPASLYDKLTQYKVNYVFVGERESTQPFVAALTNTTYFTPVYDQDGVIIYQVSGIVPPKEVTNMDISWLDWAAFFAAALYLLILPGYNIIRTLGWDMKLQIVEKIVVAFGISVLILVIVSTALALSFSIGLNFYTLMIPETIIIVLSTREVVTFARKALKV